MKKHTVSIGIPVHNEAANIKYLLQSILRQKNNEYVLEKIYVTCDGTTDGTDIIVTELSKEDTRIVLRNDGKHKGKMKRLMEMYKVNKSEYLAIFDGDVVLGSAHVLENLLKKFTDNNIVVVGANNRPLPTTSAVGKLVNTASHIWYLARKSYKNGDNVNCIRGCCMVLENNFAKSIKFPKGLISDAQFIYFFTKSLSKKFYFADDAIVYYRKPTTINDYLSQSHRAVSEVSKLSHIFGDYVSYEYEIPIKYKILALSSMFLHSPFYTISSILFIYLMRYYPYNESMNNGLWKRVNSTKVAISMITF